MEESILDLLPIRNLLKEIGSQQSHYMGIFYT